jgi:hypothetical protein
MRELATAAISYARELGETAEVVVVDCVLQAPSLLMCIVCSSITLVHDRIDCLGILLHSIRCLAIDLLHLASTCQELFQILSSDSRRCLREEYEREIRCKKAERVFRRLDSNLRGRRCLF